MQISRLTGTSAFFVIWIGQIISLFGTALFSFAIEIWLYQQTGLAITFTNRYIFSNSGVPWLQFNCTMVNLLAMSNGLRTPMILARTGNDEVILGIVASVAAVGGLVMSLWDGPKRRIHCVLWGLIMIYVGRASMGLGPEVFMWSISGFIAMFFIALCNSSNQALWQTKTSVEAQGRVFAARRVAGQLSIPVASLIAGPLSDRLFEPAMITDGSLAPIFGWLVGTSPGAGITKSKCLQIESSGSQNRQ